MERRLSFAFHNSYFIGMAGFKNVSDAGVKIQIALQNYMKMQAMKRLTSNTNNSCTYLFVYLATKHR